MLRELFSSCAERGLLSGVWASCCGGFSCFGPQAQGHTGFNSWDSWAQYCRCHPRENRLRHCGAQAWLLWSMWDHPISGIEPMYTALAGGVFTTDLPGTTDKRIFHRALIWTGAKLGKEYIKAVYCHTAHFTSTQSDVCLPAESLHSCPALCDPMDCSPPDSPILGDSPGKNTGVGCHALL